MAQCHSQSTGPENVLIVPRMFLNWNCIRIKGTPLCELNWFKNPSSFSTNRSKVLAFQQFFFVSPLMVSYVV